MLLTKRLKPAIIDTIISQLHIIYFQKHVIKNNQNNIFYDIEYVRCPINGSYADSN